MFLYLFFSFIIRNQRSETLNIHFPLFSLSLFLSFSLSLFLSFSLSLFLSLSLSLFICFSFFLFLSFSLSLFLSCSLALLLSCSLALLLSCSLALLLSCSLALLLSCSLALLLSCSLALLLSLSLFLFPSHIFSFSLYVSIFLSLGSLCRSRKAGHSTASVCSSHREGGHKLLCGGKGWVRACLFDASRQEAEVYINQRILNYFTNLHNVPAPGRII